MKYEVYLDTVFLIQFVMDYCALSLTASLMKLKVTRLRIMIASMTGAIGSCLFFLPVGVNGYLKFVVIFIVFAMIMAGISFRVRGMRQYLCMLLTIVATTFLLGGMVQWLMAFFGGKIPVLLWLSLVFGIYAVLQQGLRLYRRQKSLFVPVTLSLEDTDEVKKITVVALKDTGNRLREEETGKAVCILEEGIMPFTLKKEYQVTYHTLGTEADAMKAQLISRMVIHTKEGDVTAKDVMLAFYPGKISKKGAYHMILHPEYLKED